MFVKILVAIGLDTDAEAMAFGIDIAGSAGMSFISQLGRLHPKLCCQNHRKTLIFCWKRWSPAEPPSD